MRRLCFIRLFIMMVILAAYAHPSGAVTSTRLRTASGGLVSINAEKMVRDTEKKIIELSGNVQIVYDQQYLSCDQALVDETTETVVASGNLVISSPQAYVEGDSATLSYRDNTGIIQNGFVKSGQVLFEGSVVRKTGPDNYEADRAKFTACTTCPTAWTFSGSRIQAEIGGYAYIKNSILEVAGVPVLWLPYLIVPLKSERQTGLLVPTFGDSPSGGGEIAMNFFWAISRSQDALISAKHYTKRGLKGALNYRYVLNGTSGGELNTAFIRDTTFGATPEYEASGSRANRWFVNYYHNYDLPNGFNQQTKLNFASDLRYPRDFPEEMPGSGDPALENRFTLTKNAERTHASADASFYINQLKTKPLASNRDAIQRWPELRWSLIERPITDEGPLSRVLLGVHLNYANFAREDFAFDDVYTVAGVRTIDIDRSQADAGIFDPKDLSRTPTTQKDVIRAGQRFDIQPMLSVPFRLGSAIDVLPSVQLRHTQYSLNVNPPPNASFEAAPYRQLVRTQLSFRTRFSRIFGDRTPEAQAPRPSVTNWVDSESRVAGSPARELTPPPTVPSELYRHEIEPEIVYSGVPYFRQTEDSSFFGLTSNAPSFLEDQPLSDSDFTNLNGRGIQFDYEDRITNRNTVSFIMGNRLVRKAWDSGTPTYRQIASLKIAQTFDIDEERRTGNDRQKFAWSDISVLADVRFTHFETNSLFRYYPIHGKVDSSSRARIMDGRGHFLEASIQQKYLITVTPADAYRGRTETMALSAGLDSKYLTFSGSVGFVPTDARHDPLSKAAVEARSFDSIIPNGWSAYLNIKPPGNCWGIRINVSQPLGGELKSHLDFDYNFGGEAPSS